MRSALRRRRLSGGAGAALSSRTSADELAGVPSRIRGPGPVASVVSTGKTAITPLPQVRGGDPPQHRG